MRIDGFVIGRTEWTVMKAVAYAAIGQNALIVCANDDRKKEIAQSAKFYVPITQGFPVLVSIVPDGVSVVPIRESMMLPEKRPMLVRARGQLFATGSEYWRPGKLIDCDGMDAIRYIEVKQLGQMWWR